MNGTGEEGYMYEVPLLAIIVGVVGLVLMKAVPRPWMAWTVCALLSGAILFFLWYNFLAPGWLPGGLGQQASIAATVLFLLLAIAVPPVAAVKDWAGLTVVGAAVGGLGLVFGIRGAYAIMARFRGGDPPKED